MLPVLAKLMMKNKQKTVLISTIFLGLSACSQTSGKLVDSSANEKISYQQAVEREQAIAKNNPWHAAKLKGASFRAIGQEPAWLIEFYPHESIYLSRDYGSKIQTFNYQKPVTNQVERRSVFMLEINNKKQGEVIIEGIDCTDSMSGEKFESTVMLTIDGKTFKGCGKSLY